MNGKTNSCLLAAALAATGCASPLIKAVREGDTARIDALLARGYDMEKRGFWDGYTALGAAVERRDEATIRKLAAKGAHLDRGLAAAINIDDVGMLELMVELGADFKDEKYGRYLRSAAGVNNLAAAKFFVDNGADVNIADEQGNTPLSHSLWLANIGDDDYSRTDVAKFLVAKGADVEAAMSRLEDLLADTKASNKNRRRFMTKGIKVLKELEARKDSLYAEAHPAPKLDPEIERVFEAEAARYRSLAVKPALPEAARRFKVQAEAAVRKKEFDRAAERYAQALEIAPWWPEGRYNRALIIAELGLTVEAAREMKRYLKLVPDAADARKAQDKVYEWEDR